MITGGEPAEVERLRRDDQEMIRSALIEAGRTTPQDRQTMISDVVAALNAAANGKLGEMAIPQQRRKSAARMASAMNLLCTGADGRIFDSPGEPWPDADVTVVELGYFARKGYEDRLAIAMTGLMTAIQNRVEAEQMTGRQTIVVVDEAHVLLQNPLVSPYLSRIVATWRTYGAWLWLATQNLRQFPDSSKELLNQPEWWIMLAVDEDEIDQIARFRTLTNEQRSMILSAHKKPGRYTEGVVLSSSLLNLFRNIPPPIALALAQTEKDEKAVRDRLCRKRGITELEAAQIIAERIRQERCHDMIRFVVPVIWLMSPMAGCLAAEWPELIEVFIDGKTRIQGIGPARSSGADVQLHDVAVIRDFERALTHGLPADPTQAARAVKRRLVGIDERLREATVASSTARSLATGYGIREYPTIVVDRRYVYGSLYDVRKAVALWRRRQR